MILLFQSERKYVSRDTCIGYLPPLGKSSAFLGKGWAGNEIGDQWRGMVSRKSYRLREMRVVIRGMTWCPISHKLDD